MKILTALALALLSMGAHASEYYVVVPVKGKVANAPVIQVALGASGLPGGMVGVDYSYDFKQNLQVTGDPNFSGSGASWLVTEGSIPNGLALDSSSGILSGTPLAGATYPFTVQATYKSKAGAQSYQVAIAVPESVVLQAGGYRTWSNGTFATSCAAYRNPVVGYAYSGDTGSGVYRIQPAGQSATDVACDMTTDGGGWTLIVHGGAPGSLTAATWNVTSAVNSASVTNSANNASASKFSDSFIAALPRTAGYRFEVYGGTGAGTTRYVSPTCVYQHATAIVAASACNYSYTTLAQAQAAGSTGRYGGGGKTWHYGFSDDANTNLNSLYVITNHRYNVSDNALWYTGNGGAAAVTNAAQGGRYRLWVK